jgi:hypothetical protein
MRSYCSFAYSALAFFKDANFGVGVFQMVKKSKIARVRARLRQFQIERVNLFRTQVTDK